MIWRLELRRVLFRSHRDAGGARRRRRAQVVAGVVHEDDEIVALRPERAAHPGQQPEVGRDLPQGFDKAHHRHPLHAVQDRGSRGLQRRAAERLEACVWKAASQRRHDGGGVRVPPWLTRRNVDPRPPIGAHGRVVARGEAWMASATRKASASACAPAAPDTRTSSSPRAARTKLSSSSCKGSASAASSRTCATTCSRRVAPRLCPPGLTRKKSAVPCPRSTEKYAGGWKTRS